MDLPETIRKRLEDFSRNVLFDQSRTQTFTKENGAFLPHGKLKNIANVTDELALMVTELTTDMSGWTELCSPPQSSFT